MIMELTKQHQSKINDESNVNIMKWDDKRKYPLHTVRMVRNAKDMNSSWIAESPADKRWLPSFSDEKKTRATMKTYKKIAGNLLSVSKEMPLIELELLPIKRKKKPSKQNCDRKIILRSRKSSIFILHFGI